MLCYAGSKSDANDECNDTGEEIIKETAIIGQNRLIDEAKVFCWATISQFLNCLVEGMLIT